MKKKYREILAVLVILAIAIALSLPSYLSDAKAWRQYRQDVKDSDIKSVSPAALGLDIRMLQKGADMLKNTNVTSLLVLRHGEIAYERYYKGSDLLSCNNIYDLTRTVTAALVGITIDDGYLHSVDQKILDYVPEYFVMENNEKKKDITLKQLLTATSGVADAGLHNASGGAQDSPQVHLKYDPGTRFVYGGPYQLLSVILADTTRKSLYETAYMKLFLPLDIKMSDWGEDLNGFSNAEGDMDLRPRDLAKFGLLYLNRGVWNGQQVIPSQWVEESLKPQVDFSKGWDSKLAEHNLGLGYGWWMKKGFGHTVYATQGKYNQWILLIPDLDMVIVSTGKKRNETVSESAFTEIVNKYILQAVKDKN